MRITTALLGAGTAACLAITPVSAVASQAPKAQAVAAPAAVTEFCEGTVACWEMNEPAEATVMVDNSGNGLDAPVDQTGIDTGYQFDGETAYHWVRRPPEQYPPSPERVIQIDDNALIDPGSGTFTVEIRYRTKEKFGNITQKGQSATRGGQWKIQNPQGIPSCLFKGSQGRAATGAKTPLNDNLWHTLTCVRTPSSVTMYVDGVFRNRKNGATGLIDNSIPMTVGGKINCDQLETTCDYFSGQIDYITLTKG